MVVSNAGPWSRIRVWLLVVALATVSSGSVRGAETSRVGGRFVVYWVDDFTGGGSHPAYRLRDMADGGSVELVFATPPAELRSGDIIVVDGIESAPGIVHVQRYERRADVSAGQTSGLGGVAAPPSGEQRTAVLLLEFHDATQACTASQVEQLLFTASDSVSRAYAETSSGRVSFAGKAFGPFLIDAQRSESCNPFGWAAAANRLAEAAGVDLRAYPRRLYLIATNPGWSCGWGGISEVGVTPSMSVVEAYGGCGHPNLHAHELGHALGMHHANADPDDSGTAGEEYGDWSDFMGNGGLGHTNAPHKLQMGWIAPEAAPVVQSNGRFPLRPLETPLDSPWWPAMLRIARPGSGSFYYVSLRRRIGFDAGLDEAFSERTSIHHYDAQQLGGRTALVRTLADHETFAGSGFVVSQLARSAGGAFVEVAFSCQRFPAIVATSGAVSDGDRSHVRFDLSVRNDDTALCPPTGFSVRASGPAGWSLGLTPSTVTVSPKGQADASVRIEVPPDAVPATYDVVLDVSGGDDVQHRQITVPVTVLPRGGGNLDCADASSEPLVRARCLTAELLAAGPCATARRSAAAAERLRRRVRTLDRVLGRIAQAPARRRAGLAARVMQLTNRLSRFLSRQAREGRLPTECATTTVAAVNQLRPLVHDLMTPEPVVKPRGTRAP